MMPSRRGFLAGAVGVAAAPVRGEQGGAVPARIGVVNVRSCFEKDKYARMAEALEDLGKLRDQLAKEADDLQKRIDALVQQLNGGISRNGELYVEKLRLRAHAEYDLKLLQEVARRKIRDRMGDLETRVYADIRRVVSQIARGSNLDLVLRVEEPRLAEDDPEAGAVQRLSRDVLYHQDALEITPQVLARLNADWTKAWTCAACKRKVPDDKCPDCGAKKP